jgi:hypothetical protein
MRDRVSLLVLVALLFCLAMLFAGCGGNAASNPTPTPGGPATGSGTGGSGSGGSGSGGSGGGGASLPTAEYLYVSGILSDNIWGYRFDPSSGALTGLAGFPMGPSSNTTAHMLCDKWCGATQRWLTGDPLGKFLLEDAAIAGGGALFSFTVDAASGALTQDDALAGFSFNQQQIDPQGRFVASDLPGPNQTTLLNIIAIDRNTGHLSQTPGSPYIIPTTGSSSTSSSGPALSATQIYEDLDERGGASSSIYGFNVGSSLELTPTPGSPYDSGNLSSFIAIHPTGKWVYAASVTFLNNVGVAQYQEYTVNSDGSLTPSGSPVVTNSTGGGSMTFLANGKFALVDDAATAPSPATSGGGGMSVYSVDPSTGALTKVAFYADMKGAVTPDSTGNWVFNSAGQGTINVYRVDPNSGALTKQGSTTVPVDLTNDDTGAIAVVSPR